MFLAVGALAVQALVPFPDAGHPWWRWAAAGAFAFASGVLLVGSSMRFYRAGVSADPVGVDHPRALVSTGVYRVTRNPMYVGMACALAAHASIREAWAWLPAACFVVLVDRAQIPVEERALRNAFPDEYAAYTRRVPRWLGVPRA